MAEQTELVTFEVKRGDGWQKTFFWREPISGEVIPLTGCTARMEIRAKNDALILDCSDYLTVDEAAGSVTVDVLIPDTVTPGTYYFDIQLESNGAKPKSTPTMCLIILKDITRPVQNGGNGGGNG